MADAEIGDDAALEPVTLAAVDAVLIAAYFVMVAAVGFWAWLKERRGARAAEANNTASSSDDFFLAGRSMKWPAIGLSLFVSNIGSEHLVGLAGSAAATGVPVGFYEWSAGVHILVLGWLFAPIYLRARISTLPEYLERRYSRRLRVMLSVVSLFIYVFTKLSVSVFSGATVLRVVFGWPLLWCAVGLVVLTAAYTVLGGLAAVIYTDMAQSVVLLVGAACMMAAGLDKVGGLSGLMATPPAGLSAAEWNRFFHMYRPPDDPYYPTLGMLLGTNVGGLWYWCLDQAIAQRVLAARDVHHARAATVFAGYLKLTPIFLMVLPGIVARALFADELAGNTNSALPLMMKRLLPPGILGLMLAATVAACMSSLDSVFTAAASLFCIDLWKGVLRPRASGRELVAVGRVFCVVLAVVTILWLPVIELLSDQVFVYIQSVSMYLAPPIVCVYFLGVLWWRANAHGATAAFIVGYTLGVARLVGEIVAKVSPPPAGSVAAVLVETNYLYAGLVLFGCSVAAHVVVSLLTPRPAQAQVHGLTVDLRRRRWCNGCAPCVPRARTEGAEAAAADGGGAGGGGGGGTGGAQAGRAARKGKLPMLAAAACSDAPHSDTQSVVADLEMSVTIAGAEPAAADAAAPAVAEPPPAAAAVADGAAAPTAPAVPAAAAGIVGRCGAAWRGWWEVHFSTVNGALSILLVAIVVVLVGSWM